jgi:DNA-binding transcriptional LysR family regulator
MSRTFDPLTLRLFVAVCEEGSIARAAEREALVASAVSKRIAAVEQAVGAALLVRGRRGIQPTAAGEALLRQSRDLLGAMDRLQAELSAFATGVQGSVRVVASVSALAERLPEDLAAFLVQHQNVRVSVDERLSAEIARAVQEGSADLGVLWDQADLGELAWVPYHHDQLCALVPAHHPLAALPAVPYARTLDHPTIGMAPHGLVARLLRREAALLGRETVSRIQVSSIDAACRIVAAGLGLAILPLETTAPLAQAAGLRAVPLTDAWARRRFVVCYRSEVLLTAAARQLRDALVQASADAVLSPPPG